MVIFGNCLIDKRLSKMDTLNLYGLFGALFIGTVLGLTGGGGSILTVPVLVYLLSINPVTATAYSLFIVGSTALVGAIRNAQKGMIEYKVGIVFAIPAFISVFLTRKVIEVYCLHYLTIESSGRSRLLTRNQINFGVSSL